MKSVQTNVKKYVGVQTQDLIDVYKLFIRSLLEYCSVAFHSSLTQENTQDEECVQKTCLKVILGDEYESYSTALEISGLESLHSRRESRCLDFAFKCAKHPVNCRLFPENVVPANNLRQAEKFVVNFARTSSSALCNPLLPKIA